MGRTAYSLRARSRGRHRGRACLRAIACVLPTALLLALMLAPAASAAPPWVQVGSGALNASTAASAGTLDAAMVGADPHVAWTEAGAIYARSWSGSSWTSVGGRINGAGTGAGSRIASDGTRPWVTFVENVAGTDEVHVRQWDGTAWAARGGALNVSATTATQNPDIAFSGTTPYVAWRENGAPPTGYVKRWDGSAWVSLGSGINVDATRDISNPTLAIDGTTPYVAMQQWNGTKWQVYVRRWDGTAWVTLGGSLNVNTAQNAWTPKIALDGSTPYVMWQEEASGGRYIYVKRWDGTSWVSVGSGAVNPYWGSTNDIAISGGTPYVTWAEWNNSNYEQVAARWTGSQWRQIGGGLNIDHMAAGSGGALMMNGSEPWVAWDEAVGSVRHAFVKRYAPNNSMVGPLRDVAVRTSPTEVLLSWTNPSDAAYAGVRIYRSTTQGTLGSLVGTVAAGATPNDAYSDSTVAANTTYYYHLVAYDSLGNEREAAYETGESFIDPRRYGGGVATDGSRLWTFGGCFNCTVTDEIWAYDSATDIATRQTAVLPSPRVRSRSVWVGGTVNRAFILGGDDATTTLADIVTYDPATGAVTTTGTMPGGRVEGAVVHAPNTNRIYYLGGGLTGGATVYDTIYEIDPATGTARDTGLTLPQATWRINAVYWPRDGCIYVFGGSLAGGAKSDKIIRFCPETGTVSNLAVTLPDGRSEITATAGADEIYLFGGDNGSYLRDTYGFNPEANTLLRHAMQLPIPMVTNTAATVTGASIYAVMPYPRSAKVLQLAPSTMLRARTTQLPATPVNTRPSDGQLVGSGSIALAASAYSDPDGDAHSASHWQVRTNAGTWASPLWDSGTTTSSLTSATTASITGDGTYWFRVRYRDSNFGWSAWSTETSFAINEQAPNAIPTSPANGAWVTSDQPLLEARVDDLQADPAQLTFEVCASDPANPWSSTCDATYQSGTSLPNIANGATGGWAPATPLAQGTWYWRVRADDGIAGPWSSTRTVRVDSVAPPVPTGASAQRSGVGKITITWNGVGDPAPGSGSVTYDVETSTDGSNWSATCTDVTTNTCTKSGLGGQELLHVRVRACDLAGNCSDWIRDSASTGSGYYVRSTASTLLGTPNKVASLPPGAAVNTATSIRHHNRSGWFVFEPGTTSSATPGTAGEPASTPHASPTGAGWVVDDYAGKVASAGPIEVGITTSSNSGGGVGTLHCRAYKVTTSGGSISAATFLEKAAVTGDAIDGLSSIQRTCSLTGLATQTTFAADEALYVELWLQVSTAGPAGSTTTLSVDDGSTYVLAPSAGFAPSVPVLVSPAAGATSTSSPTLTATYGHPTPRDGLVEFQLATDAGFTSIVATGSSSTIAAGTDASWTASTLTAGSTYYWRARGVDKDELVSSWSSGRAFTVSSAPATPVAGAPVGGASTDSLTPTLSASAFSDADAGDSHGASEWQVRIATGSYATPAASSGVTTSALTSWAVPAGALDAGATYAWRVRYRDSFGSWSAWSADATFVASSGAGVTLAVDSTTPSLGLLAAGVDRSATTVATVSTTNATGYQLQATDTSDTQSLVGPGAFEDWTGTDATPSLWSAGTSGTSGYFGATVVATGSGAGPKLAKWGTGTTADDYALNRYAGLRSTSNVLLHERLDATGPGETVTIGWRSNAATTTPAGAYSVSVTLTAVARP